ncbi:MAG: glycosyltransferase [Spirochaetaceae bacterium]|jgi:glycosyltransferase involved in cell wall biosynthesis|nr:glycosyltransferase [Spirochaetaceae bacterium]
MRNREAGASVKKYNAAFFPFECNQNKYIDLMKKMYAACGVEIKPFCGLKNLKNIDFIILNWYESAGRKDMLKRSVMLFLFFVKKKKIVWTMHNKHPHDTAFPFLSRLFMRVIEMFSYKIIIHSRESLKFIKYIKKAVYIPHPCYINAYGPRAAPEALDGKRLKLLFVGQIRRYKNIEILISAFNSLNLENAVLTVCGMAAPEYALETGLLINGNKNIQTRFEFIKDEEMPGLIANHHILVFPYDLRSSLNSGSIILSFSYKRTVIAPLNGTLADMNNKDLFFSYEYKNERDHEEKLKNKILEIYTRYKDNYNELLCLGECCHNEVLRNNGMDVLVKEASRIFHSS